MNTPLADTYEQEMANGRFHLQEAAKPSAYVALQHFVAAKGTSSTPQQKIQATQMAGIAARKCGMLFEAIDELTEAHALAEREDDCLLIATTLRDLGTAYQMLYNRRYQIERLEDREIDTTDDGQTLSPEAYRRASVCFERSRRILVALTKKPGATEQESREAFTEYYATVGFVALLAYQRARRHYGQSASARSMRRHARTDIRLSAKMLHAYDNRVYELNTLKRALRMLWWFERPVYLVRALYLTLRPGSKSRGDLLVVIASAFGDRVTLMLELTQYVDDAIVGEALPINWTLG